MSQKITTFILLFFCIQQIKAATLQVSPSQALQIKINPKSFLLERSYSSRSLHQGYFGQGWCTPWDRKLIFFKPQRIWLMDCSHSTDYEFKKNKNGTFQSENKDLKLQWTGLNYQLNAPDGISVFNSRGLLTQIKKSRSKNITLQYISESLLLIKSSTGEFAKAQWDEGFISRLQILQPQKETYYFSYDNNNLILVQKGDDKKIIENYVYNKDSNLTLVHIFPSLHKKIDYISARDKVLRISTLTQELK